MTKTLLLMRHAKSDWDADYRLDHDRPLSERGVRNARSMGRVLSAHGLEPQVVISSTALRAKTTAQLAIEEGGWETELRLDATLYESGPEDVLGVGASAPEVSRLMMVGHQPTWSILVAELTGERVEMKTATVAVLELEMESWAGLRLGKGTLTRVLDPKSRR